MTKNETGVNVSIQNEQDQLGENCTDPQCDKHEKCMAEILGENCTEPNCEKHAKCIIESLQVHHDSD